VTEARIDEAGLSLFYRRIFHLGAHRPSGSSLSAAPVGA
jgi:hypothetical protein